MFISLSSNILVHDSTIWFNTSFELSEKCDSIRSAVRDTGISLNIYLVDSISYPKQGTSYTLSLAVSTSQTLTWYCNYSLALKQHILDSGYPGCLRERWRCFSGPVLGYLIGSRPNRMCILASGVWVRTKTICWIWSPILLSVSSLKKMSRFRGLRMYWAFVQCRLRLWVLCQRFCMVTVEGGYAIWLR